jgi:D-alanine-D-alanine ligase
VPGVGEDSAGQLTSIPALDVVFPVLHGTFGEDGTLQGVLEMAGLPYVGCGVAASALAMDKSLAKMVFASLGIPQAPYTVTTAHQWNEDKEAVMDSVEQVLGYAVFVKPANLGSSVGVGKAKNRQELSGAINDALQFDNKVVIEKSMENCHEVECSVLGNQDPRASVVGEIIPGAEFYNYETKYIDDKSQLVIPAPLDDATTARVQQLAIESFRAIDGTGLARVDFFVDRNTMEVTLNEVNTLPGFTPISMYPRLWAASGIPYPQLIDQLIELALQHHASKQGLKRAF